MLNVFHADILAGINEDSLIEAITWFEPGGAGCTDEQVKELIESD